MADETDDLEYSEANVGSAQAQGVRKNISLKLKGKGRGRGRRTSKARRVSTKKSVPDVGEEDDENEAPEIPTDKPPAVVTPVVAETKIEEVLSITKLETPSFNPLDRTIPEPLHQNKTLRWDHKVNLIGEKVIDPLIHCCEKCALPILNYGRLIACKHVFCYDCAKKADKCPKCDEKITRVEQSTLGTVFMCNYGGTRHVPGTCGRTYLSQRDLQAHINHRHTKPASGGSTSAAPSSRDPRDPRAHTDVAQQPLLVGTHLHDDNRNPLGSPPVGQRTTYPHSPASGYQTSIPVSSARPNLITVPIQDDSSSSAANPPAAGVPPPHIHAPVHPVQYTSCTTPPLQMPPNSSYPGAAYPPQHPPTYSQAQFSQPPPPVVHPPQMPPNAPPIYSAPPPVVHHAPPPTSYTPARPPATYTPPRPPPRPPMPPQAHFPPPAGGTYEDPPPRGYMQQWNSAVPPPPNRTAIPPRPISQPPPSGGPQAHMQPPRGGTDPGYRPPYYQ